MPRPRFNKISSEKRERIIEIAAKEFSQYGFELSSLNRILETAGVSKGAAYYYFDDKADLFITVVQYYCQGIHLYMDIDINELTAGTFWSAFTRIYQQHLIYTFNHPVGLGIRTAINKLSGDSLKEYEVLTSLVLEFTTWITALLKKGQAIGVIRNDLPDNFLVKLFLAIDATHDEWLLSQSNRLTKETVQNEIIPDWIDLLHRVLDPRMG